MSLQGLEKAQAMGLDMLTLHNYTSFFFKLVPLLTILLATPKSKLQPLDVSIYASFKQRFYMERAIWMHKNAGQRVEKSTLEALT